MKKTTTVTYEYDNAGRVTKEVTVEEDATPATTGPYTVPYPVPYPVYPQYRAYWYQNPPSWPLYQTITCNALA